MINILVCLYFALMVFLLLYYTYLDRMKKLLQNIEDIEDIIDQKIEKRGVNND